MTLLLVFASTLFIAVLLSAIAEERFGHGRNGRSSCEDTQHRS
jgi:hypothetical protein